jgi:hypothetical protein
LSFIYIKPGVVLNPNRPEALWVFITVTRGRSELYNVDISFQDMIRSQEIKKALESKTIPQEQLSELAWSDLIHLHYNELGQNTADGLDREVGQFEWRPPAMDNEQYDILSVHRKGTVREQLRIKLIGQQWQYAMRVIDPQTNSVLIKCRDPNFPVDTEWGQNLPVCFPNY